MSIFHRLSNKRTLINKFIFLLPVVLVTTVGAVVYALSVGQVDPDFNPNANGALYAAVQSDGKVLIGGEFGSVGGVTNYGFARVTSTGRYDTTFVPSLVEETTSIVVQPDQKILWGGWSHFIRYTSTGLTDPTFSGNIMGGPVFAMVTQPDGKILVGGSFTSVRGTSRSHLTRVTTTGRYDTTFTANATSSVNSIALEEDGDIIVGGTFGMIGGYTRNRIARLSSTGLVDQSFDPNANGEVRSVVIQPDGKILVGGTFTTIGGANRSRLARLTTTGLADPSFDPNPNSSVRTILLQSDGKIYIGGAFTAINGTTRFYNALLNSDGTLDPNFSPIANGEVRSMAFYGSDKLITVGTFTAYGGTGRNSVARVGIEAPVTCGNSTIETGESCDDGNTNSNDGCSNVCAVEVPSCTMGASIPYGFAPVTGMVLTGERVNTGATFYRLEANFGGGQRNFGRTGYVRFGTYNIATTGYKVATGFVRSVYSGDVTAYCQINIPIYNPGITIGGCGDGVIQGGEQCDDRNANNLDGCSSSCQYEIPTCVATVTPGTGSVGYTGQILITGSNGGKMYRIDYPGGSAFPNNAVFSLAKRFTSSGAYLISGTVRNPLSGNIANICNFTGMTYANICGNGIVQTGNNEQCDDHNTTNFDGCSSSCLIETPTCTLSANPNSGYTPLLVNIWGTGSTYGVFSAVNRGNGVTTSNNTWTYAIQTGYTYTTGGTYLITGTIANQYSGSAVNYCGYEVNLTTPICGDSIIQTSNGEQCDDGNTTAGDACSAICQLEAPTCSIQVSPSSGREPVSVTATGTVAFGGYFTSLNRGDGNTDANPALTGGLSYIYTGADTYVLTGIVANPYSGNITASCTATVNAIARACGDGILDADQGEQCDDGNTDSNDGCTNICGLEMPSCEIFATPDAGTVPFTTHIFGSAFSGGLFTGLAFSDTITSREDSWTGTVDTGYTYTTAGSYLITGTVMNPYSGSMIASCYTNVTASLGGGGPARVIPRDNCPDGDYSSTPYDNLCGTAPTGSAGGNEVTTVTTGSVTTGTNAEVTGGVTTGSVLTGSQVETTGSVTTGFVAPEVPVLPLEPNSPFEPVFPAVPMFNSNTVDLYEWAYTHGVTTMPLGIARPFDTVLRYELAIMLVQFAENVMKTRIEHNPLCEVTLYNDFSSFDTEMKEHITKVCDLGLMGWSIRNEVILDAFRPFDTLSVEELNIVIQRYLGENVPLIERSTRKEIWEFLQEMEETVK